VRRPRVHLPSDRENHGHRPPDRRQPPQCLEKHRAEDGRGQGGVEPERSAAWADLAAGGGARRGPPGFRAVSGGAALRAGAAGWPRGATRRDRGARGLAAAARLAGGGGALQARPEASAASRAHDPQMLRGGGRPRVSSGAEPAGARSGGSAPDPKRNRHGAKPPSRAARNSGFFQGNPIFARPASAELLGALGVLAVRSEPLAFPETAENPPKPAKITSETPKSAPIPRGAPAGMALPRRLFLCNRRPPRS
jgi:hypothetical protein